MHLTIEPPVWAETGFLLRHGALPSDRPAHAYHVRLIPGQSIEGVLQRGSGRTAPSTLPVRLRAARLDGDAPGLAVMRGVAYEAGGWSARALEHTSARESVRLPGAERDHPGRVHHLLQVGPSALAVRCADLPPGSDEAGIPLPLLDHNVYVAAGPWRLARYDAAALHSLGTVVQADVGAHLSLYARQPREGEPVVPLEHTRVYLFADGEQRDLALADAAAEPLPQRLPVVQVCPPGVDLVGSLTDAVRSDRVYSVHLRIGGDAMVLTAPNPDASLVRLEDMVETFAEPPIGSLQLYGPGGRAGQAEEDVDLFHPLGPAADGDLAYVAGSEPGAVIAAVKRGGTSLAQALRDIRETGLRFGALVVVAGRPYRADERPAGYHVSDVPLLDRTRPAARSGW